MDGLTVFLIVLVAFILWCILFAYDLSNNPEKYKRKQKEKSSPFGFPEFGFKKMSDFSKTQLIGGTRFLENYRSDLISLYENDSFMSFIRKLRKTVDGGELTGTKLTNRKIANTFYHQKMNDLFPEVNRIAQAVRKYGSQASAHISIYYAMFIFEEDEY